MLCDSSGITLANSEDKRELDVVLLVDVAESSPVNIGIPGPLWWRFWGPVQVQLGRDTFGTFDIPRGRWILTLLQAVLLTLFT